MTQLFELEQHADGTGPRRIGIVAYDGFELLDLTGPLDVFAMTNEGFSRSGCSETPPYTIEIIAKAPGPVAASCGVEIRANSAYGELRDDIHTLLVPGTPDVNCMFVDSALGEWVGAMSARVRRVVSVCTGAFLLAKTGLLDGRRATTHWAYCERLAADYPSVTVESDPIFVRDGPIATSGGITSGIDLALALVEEDWGREQALMVAQYMVCFLKRPGGQSQFSGYMVSEATSHPDVRALQMWVMEHPAEDLRNEVLAERMAMSPRNFARVFQAESGMTPAKFVEKARLDAARHLLGATGERIETIAVRTGFGDAERMRRAFVRNLGISPQAFRERFSGHGPRPDPSPVATESADAAVRQSMNRF